MSIIRRTDCETNRLGGKQPVSTIPFNRADMKVYLYCPSDQKRAPCQGFVVCLTPSEVYRFLSDFSKLLLLLVPSGSLHEDSTWLHPLSIVLSLSNTWCFSHSFPHGADPSEFLWELSDIHICLLLHQKFHARLDPNWVSRS